MERKYLVTKDDYKIFREDSKYWKESSKGITEVVPLKKIDHRKYIFYKTDDIPEDAYFPEGRTFSLVSNTLARKIGQVLRAGTRRTVIISCKDNPGCFVDNFAVFSDEDIEYMKELIESCDSFDGNINDFLNVLKEEREFVVIKEYKDDNDNTHLNITLTNNQTLCYALALNFLTKE